MHYSESMKVHFKSRESSSLFTIAEENLSVITGVHGGTRTMCDFQSTIQHLCSKFPPLVICLKALRSPTQPCAMTCSILNITNKSNHRKYEYGDLLIFMNIFLYKTAYEEGISVWKPLGSSYITSKHGRLGKRKCENYSDLSCQLEKFVYSFAKGRLF